MQQRNKKIDKTNTIYGLNSKRSTKNANNHDNRELCSKIQ